MERRGDGGPFSIKGYLKYIIKGKVWGDSNFFGLLASMWPCRVTVLRVDSGKQVKYRHDLGLGECNIGLLYNYKVEAGHYCALWRMDGNFVSTEEVKISSGFDEEVDQEKIESLGVRGRVRN